MFTAKEFAALKRQRLAAGGDTFSSTAVVGNDGVLLDYQNQGASRFKVYGDGALKLSVITAPTPEVGKVWLEDNAGVTVMRLRSSDGTTRTLADTLLTGTTLDASVIVSGTFDTLRIPELDASKITTGVFDPARLPAISLTTIQVVADQAARLAVTAQVGDAVKQLDTGESFILSAEPASVLGNWVLVSDISPDWAAVANKPTTLSGYGVTDSVALTTSSYSNPAWITDLAWSKISGTPTTLSGYGITDAPTLTSLGIPGLATTGITGTLTITKLGSDPHTITVPDATGTVGLLEVANVWMVSQAISNATDGDTSYIVTNTDPGASARAFFRSTNGDLTASLTANGAGYTASAMGVVLGNYASLLVTGSTAVNGLVIGLTAGPGSGKPIIFGSQNIEVARFTNGTLSSGKLDIKYTTPSTSTTTVALTVAGGVGVGGALYVGADTSIAGSLNVTHATAASNAIGIVSTATLSGAVTDGFCSGISLNPTYTAASAFTVTRHNYLSFEHITVSGSAAVTDACAMRFPAAAGTHKAVASGTTKTSPGTVSAWVKININGVLHYIPAYTSTTS